jgi:superfamily II DNA or RNA helicase
MSNCNRLTPETKQRIINALQDPTKTYSEVARSFGVSITPIRALAKLQGVPPRAFFRGNCSNRLTPETKQQIIDTLKDDPTKSYVEVAEMFGCGNTTVGAIAAKAGLVRTVSLNLSSAKAKEIAERDQRVSDAIRDNPALTYKQIGKLVGCSADLVRQVVKRNRLPARRSFLPKQRIIDALQDPTKTYSEIGEMLGCSQRAVRGVAEATNAVPRAFSSITEKRFAELKQRAQDAIRDNPNMTYKQVAALIGCTYENFNRVVRMLPPEFSRQRPNRPDISAILAWLKKNYDGSNAKAVAERFGVGVSTIRSLIVKHGLNRKKRVKNPFTFDEARAWVKSQGIRSQKQFYKHKRHPRMPAHPESFYAGRGWSGWAHFCGTLGEGKWNHTAILAFLEEIKSVLPALEDSDLIQILKANGRGFLPALRRIMRTERLTDVIRAIRGGELPARIAVQGENDPDPVVDDDEFQVMEDDDYQPHEIDLDPDMLHTADRLAAMNVSEEVVDGVMDSYVCMLRTEWVRNGDPASAIARIGEAGVGGRLFEEIKNRFLADVEATEALPTPEWNLRKNGELTEPFPMQKYVAWRMTQDRTFCNWSGTGAGKTGSAGLASFAIDSNLTVVIAPNSTAGADGWVKALIDEFKSVAVYTDPSEVRRGKGAFLVLNYEKFQGRGADTLVDQILELKPDLFVLDEAHLVKVRTKGNRSKRSIVIEGMLLKSGAKVLGMTATPVINELNEAVSLVQMIKGEKQNLKMRNTINSGFDVFQLLRRNGVRFVPNYTQEEVIREVQVRRDDLAEKLSDAADGGVLSIEQALIQPKLEAIRSFITKGTIIYVQYVDRIVPQVRAFVERLGLTVGEYIGDKDTKQRAEAKRKFIAGETDVLVASSAIKLGVDGLQETCNRMILLSLPWTHSDFLQVIGRIRRTGSKFDKAYIYIPQVVLGDGENQISWDQSRLDHIEGKRTLADCAVDGVVPTDTEATKDFLVERVKKVLKRLTRKAAAATGN